MAPTKAKSNRIFYLDIMRFIATVMVVLLHASSPYVSKNIGSTNFWIGTLIDSVVRVSVPLFVMISGALMLDKDYNAEPKKMAKHIGRMLFFFVVWSAVYSLVYTVIIPVKVNHATVDIKTALVYFLQGHFHLWFVYMIIGLYLIVPLLRLWVNDANKKYIEYFILLSMIFTFIIPEAVNVIKLYHSSVEGLYEIFDNRLQLRYVAGYTTYYLLGWYLHNYEIKNKKAVYALGIAGFVISAVGTYFVSVKAGEPTQLFEYLYINVLFQAVAAFVFIKSMFANRKERPIRFMRSVGSHSLGIYAIHVMVSASFYKLLNRYGLENALICIPLAFLFAFTFSYICTLIIGLIPGLKKVV